MKARIDRRGALALGLGAAALAALPARAQDDKGYALGDVVWGDPAAKVTVIEYASLTCPHCASFHVSAFPELKKNYIDTGKAKFILREIFFDQFGLYATMIARCGGAELYPQMIDAFLARQQDWYLAHVQAFNATKDPLPMIEEMKKIGRLGGLSNERIDACLYDQTLLDRLVADFQTNAGADEVRSTPTFFVNGERLVGAVPAAELGAAIDKALAAAG